MKSQDRERTGGGAPTRFALIKDAVPIPIPISKSRFPIPTKVLKGLLDLPRERSFERLSAKGVP